MRCLFLLPLVLFFISCNKETLNTTGKRLIRVSLNGRTHESFLYNRDQQLTKYNLFAICETNPMDEDNFYYRDGKLVRMESISRSLYSSTFTACDPSSGMHSQTAFEYNAQGRLIKISRSNSYTELHYNLSGLVEKAIIVGGIVKHTYLYEYDAKGNMVKEADDAGNATEYYYDNQINPYHLIKYRPGLVSAFTTSPNNVVKATGSLSFTRDFEYDAGGWPATLKESGNNSTYIFEYSR